MPKTVRRNQATKDLRVLSSKEYGDNCKKLIVSKNLSQSAVAARLNMTKDALWKRLDGDRGRWDLEWLTRLAIALECDIGELVRSLSGLEN